jgi:hypothetical protein
MSKFFVSLIVFVILLAKSAGSLKGVKKCCKRNEILDSQSLTCLGRDVARIDISVLPPKMINESATTPNNRITRTTLRETDLVIGSIQCSGQIQKVLDLPDENSGYFISTTSGRLASLAGEFDLSFQIGDFCFDLAQKVYINIVTKF